MTIAALQLHDVVARMGVDGLLFNTSENLYSFNLTHLTGFTGSEAAILITRNERHLFTDGRYKTQARQQAPAFRTHVVRSKLDALARALKSLGVRKVGVEASRVSYEFVTSLLRKAPGLEVVTLKREFLENLRIRKTAEEKDKILAAAKIASDACKEIIQTGLVGKTEAGVAARLEALFRTKGADGIAFETIVASGDRSALPHGAPTDKLIKPNELIILDYGCRLEGYNSDETVTCMGGKASSDQNKIFEAVYSAHMSALESLRDGIGAREVDRIARQAIDKAGLGKYFLHGLGHGVGLEIHEPPYLSPKGRGVLKEGMVFTIEPGVYIEGVGGVRLESLVYLERTGPLILSGMPKKLIPVA
ncbi:MAG: aminopeptidase P family protein [Desulfomonile tiedjei]|nr:aminopeptidase P family protein [Desulfomonile tiedjei]